MKFEKLESSDLKNKYFRRTAKWDWLTKEMIQVFDHQNPRVITMDPWPQKIYLEALGELTVREYIENVAHQYPRNQVPHGLDETILEMLESLIHEEGIIAISDEPIAIEQSLRNPQTEEGQIQLEGTWRGSYQYSWPEDFEGEKTIEVSFTIGIDRVAGQSFFGKVEDDLESGGTPGLGTIKGRYSDNGIEFEKQMPVYATIDEKGNRVFNEKKKHPVIIYTGDFSRSKMIISGTWKFKKAVWLWKGIMPYRVSAGEGTFAMTKNMDVQQNTKTS